MKQLFCLGALFTEDLSHVVLVRKNRPAHWVGKLNLLGGHIEPGEEPAEAVAREVLEEAGVPTAATDWTLVRTDEGWGVVHVFAAAASAASSATQCDDEPIELVAVADLSVRTDLVEDVVSLVQQALDALAPRAASSGLGDS